MPAAARPVTTPRDETSSKAKRNEKKGLASSDSVLIDITDDVKVKQEDDVKVKEEDISKLSSAIAVCAVGDACAP